MLGLAHSPWMMMAAWIPLGIGMGLGLYDAAFATLGRIYGTEARGSITGITLIAGFASTVGWPLSAWGLAEFGWRETCFAWAAAHLVIGLPLNFFLLPSTSSEPSDEQEGKPHIAMDRNMWLLAIAFALAWTVTGAMAAHLPRLLEAGGASVAVAIAAGMLIGPAQVVARILEATVLRNAHPLLSARLATSHPSDRRSHCRAVRSRAAIAGLCGASRLWQRYPHHRSGHGAARHLRTKKLRLPFRASRCSRADRPRSSAFCLWPFGRSPGRTRAVHFSGSDLGSARRAALG